MRSSKKPKRSRSNSSPVTGRLWRALAAVALAGVLGACSPSRGVPAQYDAEFARIEEALAKLPPSDEHSQLASLVKELQGKIAADTALAENQARERDVERALKIVRTYVPAKIELGFPTSVKDWDEDGAPDGVEVHFTPIDATGSALKFPGTAEVHLVGTGLLGSARELEKWSVSAGLLANSWNESVFPAYVLRLPWKEAAPEIDSATVKVIFSPAGGTAAKTASRTIKMPAPPKDTE